MTSSFAITRLTHSRVSATVTRSAAVLIVAACTGAACGQVTILPVTIPGSSARPFAINNTGTVVGQLSEPTPLNPLDTPAQWAGPSFNLSLFPAPAGAPTGGSQSSAAVGLNDVGSAVGRVAWPIAGPGGNFASHAVRWDNGVPTDLGTVPGYLITSARAINNAGVVIGNAAQPFLATTQAVRWTPSGVLQTLDRLPGHDESYTFGINSSGQAVGYSGIYDGDLPAARRPVMWTGTTPTELTTPAGFNFGSANSINNAGNIVGSSTVFDNANYVFDDVQATQWIGGMPTLLPLLSGFGFSSAEHINAGGLIIGSMFLDAESAFYGGGVPVLWQGGQVFDLRDLLAPSFAPGSTFQISGLNDAGQIIGNALTPTGFVGFVTTVPTSSAAAVLALGATMALRRRRAAR